MQRLLLLYQTEGASSLRRDLLALGVEVEMATLADAEDALAGGAHDAIVVEAATNVEEMRRLIESPARPSRAPLVLLLRPDQLTSIDATWPVDDFVLMPVASEELALRLRRAVWRKTGIDAANVLRSGDLMLDLANYKVFVGQEQAST